MVKLSNRRVDMTTPEIVIIISVLVTLFCFYVLWRTKRKIVEEQLDKLENEVEHIEKLFEVVQITATISVLSKKCFLQNHFLRINKIKTILQQKWDELYYAQKPDSQ